MATDPLESSHPLQPTGHYRFGAIAFHWAMFVLVVIVGVLGLLHDSWPKQTQAFWINVHALIGIFLWLLLLARFGYRLRHSPPPLPSDIGAFSRRLSSPVHLTLYALMFVIPISGFVTSILGSKKTRRYLSLSPSANVLRRVYESWGLHGHPSSTSRKSSGCRLHFAAMNLSTLD
jgi:cytochrome b561